MSPWSNSVQTQGIRLRQRALSSTAPAKRTPYIPKRPEEDLVETAKLNPALAECLAAIQEIKT